MSGTTALVITLGVIIVLSLAVIAMALYTAKEGEG